MRRTRIKSGARKLLVFSLVFFLIGIAFIIISEQILVQNHYPEGSLPNILCKFFFDLGMAFAIAAIVAVIIERSLSEHHINKIRRVLGRQQEIEEAGFRSIYPNRQQFFDDLFNNVFNHVDRELKIVGICISLFKEADRADRSPGWNRTRALSALLNILERGCMVKILFLKRYPTHDELRRYGINQDADFFFMRERDEDTDQSFQQGKRLKVIANDSLACWIQLLVDLATRSQSDSLEKRKEALSHLQIREYLSLPSLSLHIADDKIYVTPYLSKRHCSTVPAFLVEGKDTPLFRAYNKHFEMIWENSDFTTPAIDNRFIELLIEKPVETIKLYNQKLEALKTFREKEKYHNPDYSGNPEYYRIEEISVEEVIQDFENERVLARLRDSDETKGLVLSGLLRKFVREKNGQWNHQDWLHFISTVRRAGYSHISDNELGYLLEEEKLKFKVPAW